MAEVTVKIRKDVPLSEFRRVLSVVGLDPDQVITGEADLSDAEYPGREEAEGLLPVMCTRYRPMFRASDATFIPAFGKVLGNFVRVHTIPLTDQIESLRSLRIRLWVVRRTKWLWQLAGWIRGWQR